MASFAVPLQRNPCLFVCLISSVTLYYNVVCTLKAVLVLTHLCRVDSSATTVWSGL